MWFRPAYPAKGPEPDIEVGPAGAMTERPELRWAFIRKWSRVGALYPYFPNALYCAAIFIPVSSTAPLEHASSRPLHSRHQLHGRINLCLHKWEGDFGVGYADSSGGDKPDTVHILGCQERP
ncbi:hypothetical protein FCM35_KLT18755 [Carex littledalei]|uniref:Uncharacterized protein n=1 Tax=Carex littledalei TaxID=544730 RepID=A0A833RMI0_9POAL|nr:hypothetical protein FCM35_KLT18755 [Carex littledalei]